MERPPLRDLIFSPEKFFSDLTGAPDRSLSLPTFIVSIASLLGLISMLTFSSHIANGISESLDNNTHLSSSDRQDLDNALRLMRPLGIMIFTFSSVFAVVLWPLATAILVCLCVLANGKGDFRQMLRLTGFAHLPLAIGGLSVLIVVLLFPPDIDFYPFSSASNIGMFLEQLPALEAELRSSVPAILSRVLIGYFYVWMYLLWVLAARRVEKFSYLKSGILVALTALPIHGIPWLLRRLF